ncbi:MAG TPA: hypothetical protein VK634_19740 [Reyranella sp.]|nr:hypothetical protein [Reyranella sp.]HTE82928.1 hypothetical protein [Reyranella sp.]
MVTRPKRPTKFVHPLGLSKIEWGVIQGALQSQTRFGIKDFLPNPGKPTQNAIKRLVDLGYLTLSKRKPVSFSGPPWLVVRLTKKNLEKYNAAIDAAAKTKAGAS